MWEGVPCPGFAAATAGHPHLLPWLLQHCPFLLDLARTLEAVARHCDLPALQALYKPIWHIMPIHYNDIKDYDDYIAEVVESYRRQYQRLFNEAAACRIPEGGAKLEWLLQEAKLEEWCGLGIRAIARVFESGDKERLAWAVRHVGIEGNGEGQGEGQEGAERQEDGDGRDRGEGQEEGDGQEEGEGQEAPRPAVEGFAAEATQ